MTEITQKVSHLDCLLEVVRRHNQKPRFATDDLLDAISKPNKSDFQPKTDHQKFKALLTSLWLSYEDLAQSLGLTLPSVKSLLAPAKKLPKWAKSMLLVKEREKR